MGRWGNLVAWGVLIALGAGAVLFVNRLGFVGLAVLGLLTLLVCSRVAMDDDMPSWGEHVFRERMGRPKAPGPDLRFFQLCGAGLATVGALGFAWQVLR